MESNIFSFFSVPPIEMLFISGIDRLAVLNLFAGVNELTLPRTHKHTHRLSSQPFIYRFWLSVSSNYRLITYHSIESDCIYSCNVRLNWMEIRNWRDEQWCDIQSVWYRCYCMQIVFIKIDRLNNNYMHWNMCSFDLCWSLLLLQRVNIYNEY